jgi:glycerophosphoryl diester phosphodiesterase
MELDLRVRGDGGFVVLHDETLEGETTGAGKVCDTSAETLRGLAMKAGGTRPILSEDLATLISTAHPEALLQFDMKDGLQAIGERGIDHLADHFADVGKSVIVSGACLDLIVAIKHRLPTLARGIDPTDKLMDILQREGPKAVEADLKRDIAGPTEPDTIYLSWPLLLKAQEVGLDLVGLCRDRGCKVDAWTFNLRDRDAGFDDAEWARFSALMRLKPDQVTTDEAPATLRAFSARINRGR